MADILIHAHKSSFAEFSVYYFMLWLWCIMRCVCVRAHAQV